MAIPGFDSHGLLPSGVHQCTLTEIEQALCWNPHRQTLIQKFKICLSKEIRPLFPDPLYFDGSFITDKDLPDDIDVVLELSNSPDARKWQGLMFMQTHQQRLMVDYRVHFWINLPGDNDFSHFFQYIGVKTAKFKGLNPTHMKGILRIT